MEILMSIVGKVVEKVLDYTVAPTARQFGYLIFYKDNFKDLENQLEELKRVKESVEHEIGAERRNGREVEFVVKNWLGKVDEISKAVKELGDDPCHMNAGCSKWSCLDLKSRHQLSRKAKKMVKNVVEVIQRKEKFNGVAYLPPLEGVGCTFTTKNNEKLESRKKMKEDIVLALQDPKIAKIGVYGLGGVGKTTLVKDIAKQVKDDAMFDAVVMATISQAPDLERIQGEIADFLGLRFEEMTIAGRAARLCKRIKQENSILVILDDIWERFDLEKVGIPLEDDRKACKLLITSRNQDTLQKMETKMDFMLDVLNKEETWSLFEDMVGDVVNDASLHSIAIQVAQKCAGLTILIVTVATTLKNKDIYFWKDAVNQLQSVDNEGMNGIIYSALEFTYSHLEGDELKTLFLLCGIIGLDKFEYYLACATGLGIFKGINTLKDARFRLHTLIRSLKASCLLLETNSNEVKMHDIVREVAFSIASRDQHAFKVGSGVELKTWPTEDWLQRCLYVLFDWCDIHEFPQRLECPKIKYFCLANKNRYVSVPDSFFERMGTINVLDLSGMHLPSLPKSFHSLTHLQTLFLCHCSLEDMTNIGALENLQILSLCGSSMTRLPNELGQLTLLKMLDLTNSGIEIFPSNIISKLTNLEELYIGNTSINWEHKNSDEENKIATLSELRHLTNLIALEIQIQGARVLPRDLIFEKLERYKIVIGDIWEWSDNYGGSKMLKLKLGTSIHLEHGIKELIKGVEELYLDQINGISNVLYHLDREGFPLLRHLHIQNNTEIQHITKSMERDRKHDFFPNLETLVLQNLRNLEKICDGSLTINSFAKLKSIKVKCCDQLKYLLSVSMVKALNQLVEIEVLECSSMKEIVFAESSFSNSMIIDDNIEFLSLRSLTLQHLPAIDVFHSDEVTSSITMKQNLMGTNVPTSFFNAKVKFSNLETLKLSSINLKNIWDIDHLSTANSFHNLANLSIEDCSGLKYLFSSSMIGSFQKLKQLEISNCNMVEEIIIATEGRNDATSEEVRLSKLETMVINNMKSLKEVWHFQFDGLKTLEVNNCEKLVNIFPSKMHRTFGSLETLKVSDCGSMEEIFKLIANEIKSDEKDTVTVTQLKKIQLCRLPKLKQIWSKDPQGIIRFHHLQDVQVEYCRNLEYLFPFSIATDILQLENLRMISCGMKKIVAKKEGPMGEIPIFDFQRLHSLVIWNMLELDGFYAENHILAYPALRVLDAFNCAKLELFEMLGRSIQRNNLSVSMQQPLVVVEEVLPSLENLNLSNKDATIIWQDQQWRGHFRKLKLLVLYNFTDKQEPTFIDSILQKAPNLESLVVQDSSVKEIFQDVRLAHKEGKHEIRARLKKLTFCRLQELQHICRVGCQIDPMLGVLKVLYVTECASLNILVPSSVTFSLLIYLEIEKCDGLINLIYSSTARSLVKLEKIKIRECGSIEEIVKQEETETHDEIVFSSLKTLELECLPKLNSFSSSKCLFKFPLLQRVVVRKCPRMKTFGARETSTPMLRKVIKDGKDEEWCWEGDLNLTLKKICLDKVPFLEHLDLSFYPELKNSWYSPIENKMFSNLKSLGVQKCDFLSNVLISSNLLPVLCNLEELEIRDCESLEVVFEFNTTNEGGMSQEESINLQKISLFNLPKLQHIWRQDCQEIVSSGDSLDVHSGICQVSKVSKASDVGGKSEEKKVEFQHEQPLFLAAKVHLPKLETIIIKDMQNLKTLWLGFKTFKFKKCEEIENIFPAYMHGTFVLFPNLETIIIKDMPQLKTVWHPFFTSNSISSLKKMEVSNCEKFENIFPSYMQTAFAGLETLKVVNCNGLTHLVTSAIARSLVNLKSMEIRDCHSLEHVVEKGREEAEDEIAFSNLEILDLQYLPMIKSFCSTYCMLNLPLLEKVVVKQCPGIKIFSVRDARTPKLEKVITNEEEEEWCWEGNINVTVKKIFQDRAIRERDEGDSKESSRNISEIIGESSFEEQAGQSKGYQIVDTRKQEIQRLASSSADRQQEENCDDPGADEGGE